MNIETTAAHMPSRLEDIISRLVRAAGQALTEARHEDALWARAAAALLGNDRSFGDKQDEVARQLQAIFVRSFSGALTQDDVEDISFSPDGSRVVGIPGYRSITATVWSVATGDRLLDLDGHAGQVFSAEFSPDNMFILTASADGTARVWMADCGSEVLKLSGHQGEIKHASFSRDGTRIVTAGSDGTARVWSAQDGALLLSLNHEDPELAVLSPDGTVILTMSRETAKIWDAGTGQLKWETECEGGACISPDSSRIYVCRADQDQHAVHTLQDGGLIWRNTHGGYALSGNDEADDLWMEYILSPYLGHHTSGTDSSVFSPDGTRLAGYSAIGDLLSGQTLRLPEWGHTFEWVPNPVFSRDGSSLVICLFEYREYWLIICNAHSGAVNRIIQEEERRPQKVVFSPDGSRLATSGHPEMDRGGKLAKIWDLRAVKLIGCLKMEDGPIYSGCYSPCGTRIVISCGDEQRLRIHDAISGRQITCIDGFGYNVSSVAFSPDGTRIVAASSDNTARIWDAMTGAESLSLSGHESWVASAAFSPDGWSIVTASDDKTARIWDAASGLEIGCLRGHDDPVLTAAFSPDGTSIVTASRDKTARIWDAASGQEIVCLTGHEDGLNSAAFSPDGTRIATASRDKTVRIWDAATGIEMLRLECDGHNLGISFVQNSGQLLTFSSDGSAGIWDLKSGAEIARLTGHKGAGDTAAISPDGSSVVFFGERDCYFHDISVPSLDRLHKLSVHGLAINSIVSATHGGFFLTASLDGTARMWDAATGEVLHVLEGHTDRLRGGVLSPDGALALTFSRDATARIWETATGRVRHVLTGHSGGIWSGSFSADGAHVLTAGADGTARLWATSDGSQIRLVGVHGGEVWSARFSPDGKQVLTVCEDGLARLSDVRTDASLHVAGCAEHPVTTAVFSPDGTRIVTGAASGRVEVMLTATGEVQVPEAGHRDGVRTLEISPDGQLVLSTSHDGSVRLVEIATGCVLIVLSSRDPVCASFSPDGGRIVLGQADGMVRLHDARTGAYLAVLRGHKAALTSAAFSPDGTRILTSSEDGTAGVWEAGQAGGTWGGRLGYRARRHAVQQGLRLLCEDGAAGLKRAPGDPSIEGIDDPSLADPGGEAESLGAFIRTAALVTKQKSAAGAAGDQA